MHELTKKALERDSFHKKFDISCNCRQFLFQFKICGWGVCIRELPARFLRTFLMLVILMLAVKKYKIFRSVSFQREVAKYDKSIQDRVDKIESKLMFNSKYGNPLGTEWFRESRFENYRIYFLVYEELDAIYMVAISGKKDRQKTINTIRLFLKFFKLEIEKLVREENMKESEEG